MNVVRNEYPRPQFVRSNWMNLNGEWEFSFDTEAFDKRIIVPYAYQTKLSGINLQEDHEVVWYKRSFNLSEDIKDKKALLHFGAVDYQCDVWVNGIHVENHIGGHIGFFVDITHALKEGENELKVKATDSIGDFEMPRGKQFWKDKSEGIFYTRTTGIWQTVWLEVVNQFYLKNVFMTPDLDNMSVEINYEIAGNEAVELKTSIYFDGDFIATNTISNSRNSGVFKLRLDQQSIKKWSFQEEMVWSPEHPRLFDVTFEVISQGEIKDRVESYFGMRKVSIEKGSFMLNNRPYYQKLLLDQGYWEESLLTAPNDEAFVKDIQLSKSMGFNGVRKHQKIEDPRFLYHADKLGFLVWGEFPAAYVYSKKYVKRATEEWMEEILRDYNHPSIVAWTPLNESWGVPNIKDNIEEQSHSAAMVYLTKSLDRTRPVISNDGWEHTCTDILTIHDYEPDKNILKNRYKDLESILKDMSINRNKFAHGWEYKGQPILITEFGGISYKKGSWSGWGYSNASSDEDFAERYNAVVSALLESKLIQGFCYTQITDVEQEINGLCTYDREPKIPVEIIKEINEGRWKKEEK